MLNSFLIVGSQVLILFLLIALGFLGGKLKITTKEGVKSMNDIMLYFVTPCVIINAFQREFDQQLLHNLLLSVLAAFISHFFSYFLAVLLIRNKNYSKKKVLRFAAMFSNCGFMALPLLDALLGSEGVFYGAAYVAVFNLLVWSFGQYIMAKDPSEFKLRKCVLNPGFISVVIGFILFITSFSLPKILATPIEYMSNLNTPVAMLIIGYTFSTLDLREMINLREEYLTIIIRLVISPILLLGIFYAMGYRGVLFVSCIVSASAPIAATTTMFAIKYDGDEALASKLVAVSTLLSIITMTLIVGFAQYII